MDNQIFHFTAASAFGLEGAISGELKRLQMKQVKAENGFVRFQGSLLDAYKCNLSLRFSDRVYILLAEQTCTSFDMLFNLIFSIPWEHFASGKEAFNISAQCARSRLMSNRDCQSIGKKAIIERLKNKTGQMIFLEKGCSFPVHISIHTDTARILLDTSGSSLSRRGYRTWNGEAPLRETLAASLVEFSPWRPGMPLYDPCCGTGTIIIEAALRQGHIAPGLNRTFSMESFSGFSVEEAEKVKRTLIQECKPDRIQYIAGSDISQEAIDLAERHLRQANLNGRISLSVKPLQNVQLGYEHGVFICNPPYGESLNDIKYCRDLYRQLFHLQKRHPTWSMCAISSDPGFEKAFGRKADKKRRLYNGRLECEFYIFLPIN